MDNDPEKNEPEQLPTADEVDQYVIQAATLIAAKYGVKLDIDADTRMLDFDCDDPVLSQKIAVELEEVLGQVAE
jgi:hypothetical protein